ncbi:MAG: SDR family oxidoreductase [Planctomycetota bacterium]|nr:SDR family oxidoreductase [Planctomycetota bacterium]
MNQEPTSPTSVLLTGATGYVGGRLMRRLELRGVRLRCLARRPEALAGKVAPETEVVAGDLLEPASLDEALEGVDLAFYLVHSMGAGEGFEARDAEAARNFAQAAADEGVRHLVYLGGLAHGDDLSDHLRSRHEVGQLLASTGVPVTELRASIVLGSGSLSFEMVRALVERLPVMICPRWVDVEAQPIAIEDLLACLLAAGELEPAGHRVLEVGGVDRTSYGELMREYARQRGLRRWMIRVPVLTPHLSSLWLGLVTPLYARVGRALIQSIRHPSVVREPGAEELLGVACRGVRAGIAAALVREDQELEETRWSDSLSSGTQPRTWAGVRFGNRLVDSRTLELDLEPAEAFAPIRRIGGETGWYAFDRLWRLRGFFDLLVGGVGVRRGRRDPEHPAVGDALDFWRVEAYEPDRLLRLAAEMRLPGRAWLEFEVEPREGGGSTIRQTAVFDPIGLSGLAYWYAVFPLHGFVFRGMLAGIGRAARASASGTSAD